MDKEQEYVALWTERKECKRCEGRLKNASRINDGQFDCDEIGAYSHWQGNLYSDLMIVGQDFADADTFRDKGGRPGSDVLTNKKLIKFLLAADIRINAPNPDESDDKLFFTNAALCMKPGGMRGPVPASCFVACGEFLRRTVRIVDPLLVVTLGVGAMNAVNEVLSLCSPVHLPRDGALPQSVPIMGGRTRIMALYHPAASRTNGSQREHWCAVGKELTRLRRERDDLKW